MLERFEPAARELIEGARQEAGLACQDQVHSEHLLLALLRQPSAAADALAAAGLDLQSLRARVPHGASPAGDLDADALARVGIDLDAVRRAADSAFGAGALDSAPVPGRKRIGFAADARQVLASGAKAAQHLASRTVSSGHLLLGLLDADRNGAQAVLAQTGVDIPALRADVLRRIRPVA